MGFLTFEQNQNSTVPDLQLSPIQDDHQPIDSGSAELSNSKTVSSYNNGRRVRTIFSSNQILGLESEYHTNAYPCRRQRYAIAERLNLNDQQVKHWFQNRRAKTRHVVKKQKCTLTSEDLSQELIGNTFTMPEQNYEGTEAEAHAIDAFVQRLLHDDIPKDETDPKCANFMEIDSNYAVPSYEQNFWIDQMQFNSGSVACPKTVDTEQSVHSETTSSDSCNEFQNGKKNVSPNSFVSNYNKSKRVRTIYSSEQILELESEYNTNAHPSRRQRSIIAERVNLNERQVKYWFQNRRTKNRHVARKHTLIPENTFTMPEHEQNHESSESEVHDIDTFIQRLLHDDMPKDEPALICSNFNDIGSNYAAPSDEQNFWTDTEQLQINCGVAPVQSINSETPSSDLYNNFQDWEKCFSITEHNDDMNMANLDLLYYDNKLDSLPNDDDIGIYPFTEFECDV